MKPKYPSQQEYLQGYKERIATGKGLSAREWDHFNTLEKFYDKEGRKLRLDRAELDKNISCAKKVPTTELIKIITSRKEGYSVIKTNRVKEEGK